MAVDHEGRLVDGDHLIAICALDLRDRGELRDDTVVVTVMANLGFRLAMEAAGIHVVETAVGDRYVLEVLDAGGYSLGGEQSGHVIFRDLATTGDGILTGLVLCDAVARAGRPLAELAAAAMTRLPQVLVNVQVSERIADPSVPVRVGDRRRPGRARRPRPRPRAGQRHRAAGPGDGRGPDRGHRPAPAPTTSPTPSAPRPPDPRFRAAGVFRAGHPRTKHSAHEHSGRSVAGTVGGGLGSLVGHVRDHRHPQPALDPAGPGGRGDPRRARRRPRRPR